ncbi:MAG: 3-oxoacid CoA-transferase, partial [Lachnospiraceae bacterium]|nr:3-oxoacid CoA-transferase [Lachnospiraceae bacterium]
MAKFIDMHEAAALVKDNDSLLIGGFGAFNCPDALFYALGERYKAEQHPKGITLYANLCSGGFGYEEAGMNRIAYDGLVDTIVAGHFTGARKLADKIITNEISAFALPLGVITHLFRASAGKKPGIITHVGLHTYADPRLEACCVNERAANSGRKVVELMQIGGKDYLFYHSFYGNVCFIRGTYADEDGNISNE